MIAPRINVRTYFKVRDRNPRANIDFVFIGAFHPLQQFLVGQIEGNLTVRCYSYFHLELACVTWPVR